MGSRLWKLVPKVPVFRVALNFRKLALMRLGLESEADAWLTPQFAAKRGPPRGVAR